MSEHDPGLIEGRYAWVPPHRLGFICLTHPEAGGEAWVHPSNVGYYTARGWVEYEPASPVELAEERPNKNATKAEWQEYAIRAGVPPDEAEAATKQELIDRLASEQE